MSNNKWLTPDGEIYDPREDWRLYDAAEAPYAAVGIGRGLKWVIGEYNPCESQPIAAMINKYGVATDEFYEAVEKAAAWDIAESLECLANDVDEDDDCAVSDAAYCQECHDRLVAFYDL